MKYWLHPSHSPTKLEEKDNEIQNLKQQMVSMQQSQKDRSIEGRCRVNPGLETAAVLEYKINSIVCEDTEGTDRKHESRSTTKSGFLKSQEIT
jgi:hypothetical protein